MALSPVIGAPAAAARAALPTRPIPTPQFRHYGVPEGLPSNVVYTVLQDPNGVLWMGTTGGLVRFDGLHFRRFRHDPRRPHSLKANDVDALLIDHRKRLWLGGEGTGINLYRPATGDFRTWTHKPGDPHSLAGNDIAALVEGPDGSIWAGVFSHGVDRLLPDGRIRHYVHDKSDADSLSSNIVLSLRALDDGTVLAGGLRGLDRIAADGHVTHASFEGLDAPPQVWSIDGHPGRWRLGTSKGLFLLGADHVARPLHLDVIGRHRVLTSLRDPEGSLWVGTVDGLYWFGTDGRHRYFPMRPQTPDGVPGALIWKLMRDHEGGMWVTTRDSGVAYLGPQWRRFTVFRHQPGDAASLNISRVLAQMSWNGRLLVGGQAARLDSVDPETGDIRHLQPDINHEAVTALGDAGNGRLWIGHTNGLALYQNGRTREIGEGRISGGVNRIATDAQHNAYVGMPTGGVMRVDHRTLALTDVRTRNGTDKDRNVTRLVAHDGQIWRSSSGGLAKLDPDTGEFVDLPGVPHERINSFAFDQTGFWLARQDSMEHFRLDASGHARRDLLVDAAHGWPEIAVVSMYCDGEGKVWLTTQVGLLRFDPKTGTFRTYGVEDGLPSPQFSSWTLVRMADGTVYSGTNGGIVGWNPETVHDHPQPPRLVLSRMTVQRDGQVHALPTDASSISLRWDDRELHVVAQALSYLDPSRNHYRFRLQGLDSGWVDNGTRGERDFTALTYGDYTLHIQAAGPSGAWAALPPLRIHVARPPWMTWWAWLVYALVGLLLLWALITLLRRRIEQRHRMQMAERERALAEQASAAKTSFLATLGHEIRTPMTGVLGMAELLLRSPLQPRQRGYAEAIQRSGTLLLRLVNEALDMARIEAGRLELEPTVFDPRDLIDDIVQLERGVAEGKGLRLTCRIGEGMPSRLHGDALRIKQILLNLLNNALKFTERGGVELGADWVDDGLTLTVADTGPGISEGDRKRLFERYEQADSPQRSSGSGLGLAICKELVALMEGRCELVASGPEGSTFRVWLPLPVVRSAPAITARLDEAPRSWNLLLIEDDATVAGVIRGLLESAGHRVRHAADGLAGLAELENHDFDALLLDLDLPGLDGFAVARMLRERETGARLPIIAITARSGGDEEEQARAAGMDGFLRKPVSGDGLQAALRGCID